MRVLRNNHGLTQVITHVSDYIRMCPFISYSDTPVFFLCYQLRIPDPDSEKGTTVKLG